MGYIREVKVSNSGNIRVKLSLRILCCRALIEFDGTEKAPSLSLSLRSKTKKRVEGKKGKQWDSRGGREPTYRRNSQFDRGDALGRINSVGVTDKHSVNIDSFNIDGGKCKKRRRANINARAGGREEEEQEETSCVYLCFCTPFSLLLFDSINVELSGSTRVSAKRVKIKGNKIEGWRRRLDRVRCWCRESRCLSFRSEGRKERKGTRIQFRGSFRGRANYRPSTF